MLSGLSGAAFLQEAVQNLQLLWRVCSTREALLWRVSITREALKEEEEGMEGGRKAGGRKPLQWSSIVE